MSDALIWALVIVCGLLVAAFSLWHDAAMDRFLDKQPLWLRVAIALIAIAFVVVAGPLQSASTVMVTSVLLGVLIVVLSVAAALRRRQKKARVEFTPPRHAVQDPIQVRGVPQAPKGVEGFLARVEGLTEGAWLSIIRMSRYEHLGIVRRRIMRARAVLAARRTRAALSDPEQEHLRSLAAAAVWRATESTNRGDVPTLSAKVAERLVVVENAAIALAARGRAPHEAVQFGIQPFALALPARELEVSPPSAKSS
jgi:hypothetical protein